VVGAGIGFISGIDITLVVAVLQDAAGVAESAGIRTRAGLPVLFSFEALPFAYAPISTVILIQALVEAVVLGSASVFVVHAGVRILNARELMFREEESTAVADALVRIIRRDIHALISAGGAGARSDAAEVLLVVARILGLEATLRSWRCYPAICIACAHVIYANSFSAGILRGPGTRRLLARVTLARILAILACRSHACLFVGRRSIAALCTDTAVIDAFEDNTGVGKVALRSTWVLGRHARMWWPPAKGVCTTDADGSVASLAIARAFVRRAVVDLCARVGGILFGEARIHLVDGDARSCAGLGAHTVVVACAHPLLEGATQ
jgi:stage V sporulation protein SpoVS